MTFLLITLEKYFIKNNLRIITTWPKFPKTNYKGRHYGPN